MLDRQEATAADHGQPFLHDDTRVSAGNVTFGGCFSKKRKLGRYADKE